MRAGRLGGGRYVLVTMGKDAYLILCTFTLSLANVNVILLKLLRLRFGLGQRRG